jgi:GGDEF domain-containing protein
LGKNRVARVGISVGTATFGIDGDTLDQLVVAADNEMYRVKSNHRVARLIPDTDLHSEPPDTPNQVIVS